MLSLRSTRLHRFIPSAYPSSLGCCRVLRRKPPTGARKLESPWCYSCTASCKIRNRSCVVEGEAKVGDGGDVAAAAAAAAVVGGGGGGRGVSHIGVLDSNLALSGRHMAREAAQPESIHAPGGISQVDSTAVLAVYVSMFSSVSNDWFGVETRLVSGVRRSRRRLLF